MKDNKTLIEEIAATDDVDIALESLYKNIFDKIKESDYKNIDKFINEFITHDVDFRVYIGFLAITGGIKNELLNRKYLLQNAYVVARKTISDENRIKTILDGF